MRKWFAWNLAARFGIAELANPDWILEANFVWLGMKGRHDASRVLARVPGDSLNIPIFGGF